MATTTPVKAETMQLLPAPPTLPPPPSAIKSSLIVNGAPTGPGAAGTGGGKDSSWLTLEVCREYARQRCSRSEADCRFAHPPPHVEVQNGRVVCCFDSIKGRCQRTDPPCKYLHPPQHLKEQLLQNGRNNLLLRNFQHVHRVQPVLPAPTTAFYPVVNRYILSSPGTGFTPYYNASSQSAAVVLPSSSAVDVCPSMAAPSVVPASTVAAAVEQPEQESMPLADLQNTAQYWTVAPSVPAAPYYSAACSPIYYQNGSCAMPAAMLVQKPNPVATKNGFALYPCNSDAYQQMAMPAGPVPLQCHYPMAIAVPPPVGSYYGC